MKPGGGCSLAFKPLNLAVLAPFLCSPLASGITGEVLFVDCGYNVMGV